jgi:cyclic pyranopterin phosphate synthase
LNAVDTLRVSVTDRCNLRCVYCMPGGGIDRIPFGDVLRYEEVLHVVRTGASLGIRKIRITGGEPLVREGVTGLISSIRRVKGIEDVCLTTNGVLLEGLAGDLKRAGLQRVTVSLDSLRQDRYRRITGHDELGRVLAGIEAALSAGLFPLKINVVVIRDLNDDEVVDFARLSLAYPLEVRFIERMPLGLQEESRGCGLWEREGVPGVEVWGRILAALGPLEPAQAVVSLPGPARLYRVPGSPGRVGLITPMTHPFCHACTRLRLTADGKLRSCLFSSREFDVLAALRPEVDPEKLGELFRKAFRAKQEREAGTRSENQRCMAEIGG